MNTGKSMSAPRSIDSSEAEDQLEALGLTRDDLLEVVDAVVNARTDCTENDPPSAPGYFGWARGTRRMREILRPKGWVRTETPIPGVENEQRKIRLFVAASMDDGVGDVDRVPKNRSSRGGGTAKIVAENRQLSLFSGPRSDDRGSNISLACNRAGTFTTWCVCVFHEADDVRAELSLPTDFSAGKFRGFRKRIFLVGGSGEAGVGVQRLGGDLGLDSGDEFDVPVSRK